MYCNRAVCGFYVNKENKIFVVTRKHSEKFGLIGGKVDPGETEEQALKRELMEEANFAVEKFLPIYSAVCGPGSDGKAYMTTTYLIYGDVDESRIHQTEDGVIPLWKTIEEFQDENGSPFTEYNINVLKAYNDMLTKWDALNS